MSSAKSGNNLWLLNISWWIIISLIHAYFLKQSSLSGYEILIDTFVSFGLLGAVCVLIVNNMRYYLPQHEKYWYILFISLRISGICSFLSKFLLGIIFKNHAFYLHELSHSGGIRFGMDFYWRVVYL